MKNVDNLKKVILYSLFTTLPVFAHAGGGSPGGGSGVAAEITRATDAFIGAVKKYPALFPGVDPAALGTLVDQTTHVPKLDPSTNQPVPIQIFVTADPIKVCGVNSELEAWSDNALGYSKFNFPDWVKKGELDKIQLAGHERLVIAGYEKSNQYNLSNKIYDAQVKDLERVYGPAEDICSFGQSACTQMQKMDATLADIVRETKAGELSHDESISLLDMQKNAINSIALMVVGIKEAELENSHFLSQKRAEKATAEYSDRVNLAVGNHYNSLFADAQNLIASQEDSAPQMACANVVN